MEKENRRRAQFLGVYRGRRVFRFTVETECSQTDASTTDLVAAHTAADAANLVRDDIGLRLGLDSACTTIRAYGPRGGTTERYIGWDSAAAVAMWGCR